MGIKDVLKQAKAAMNPDAIRQGLEAAKQPPSAEEIAAAVAQLPPEQRAAYEANAARVEEGRQESIEAEAALRVLDGPAGDFLYGRSIADHEEAYTSGGIGAVLRLSREGLAQSAKGIYGGDLAPHEKDREKAARIGAEELAARTTAREPYLAADRAPVLISRIATRGKTQVDEVLAFLRSTGLGARPDLVYGLYRVPDRISQHVTPSSERNRVVEWEVVHGELPGPGEGTPTTAFFSALDHWVARRVGEPSVLDEDLGLAYLERAGIGPERCFGVTRLSTIVEPRDKWWALNLSDASGASDDHHPLVPTVDGVLVVHASIGDADVVGQMAMEAPLDLRAGGAGIRVAVLNWNEVARAVHPRRQHPPAAPSPFPYLPSTPQELLTAYLQVVGVHPEDCYAAHVTVDEPRALVGRTAMGTSTFGSDQPCADGKDRRRMHGARLVVAAYRDRPEYAEGCARWDRYQSEVLQAHLERATGARRPVESDTGPGGLLGTAWKAFDTVARITEIGEWQPPPPHRYCWPPIA